MSKLKLPFWKKDKPEPSFVCSVCGKPHTGSPTDYGWQLPDAIWALGEEARAPHLEWSSDVAYFEGAWFLRGMLYVPFTFDDRSFGWGVWAEVSEDAMGQYREVFRENGGSVAPVDGRLACAIPTYSETTIGLPVSVQFQDASLRPTFTIKPDCAHPITADQSMGIDDGKYHEILTAIGYS